MELMTGRNTRINNILSMKRILILISLCTVLFNGCELLLPQGHRFLPIYNNSESTLFITWAAGRDFFDNYNDYEARYSIGWSISHYDIRYATCIVNPHEYNNTVLRVYERNTIESRIGYDTLYLAIMDDKDIQKVLSLREKSFRYKLYKLTLPDIEELNWVITYPAESPNFIIKDLEYDYAD